MTENSQPKHGDRVTVTYTKDKRTGTYDDNHPGSPGFRLDDGTWIPIGQGVVTVLPPKPRVLCLSGSMRFEREMRAAAVDLSLEGHIVTGPFVNMKQPDPRWATDELADPIKVALDALHFRKIDLADEVVVVSDETGYIGDSTRNEIAYAEKHGKPVRYVRVGLPPEEPQVSMEELREKVASVVDDYTAGEDYGSGPVRYYLTVGTPDELTEHLAAVLFPGLDWLFRAVADWQALWDEKEEWTKAAKEAWQRETVLAWLHAEAVWQLRGMARRASKLRRSQEKWRRLAGAQTNERVHDMAVSMANAGQLRAENRRVKAEQDALRARLEAATATPSPDERAELLRLINERGVEDLDAEELADDVAQLLRPDGPGCWTEDEAPAPVLESVPATTEPAGATNLWDLEAEVADAIASVDAVGGTYKDQAKAAIRVTHRALPPGPPAVAVPSGVDLPEVEAALPAVEPIDERGELERGLMEVIGERDEAQEWADKLAYAIAPVQVIGEHSNGNNPWANALEVLESQPALELDPSQIPEHLRVSDVQRVFRAAGLRLVLNTEPPCEPAETEPSPVAPSEASQVQANSKLEQNLDEGRPSASTPPAAGEADTTPRVWRDGDRAARNGHAGRIVRVGSATVPWTFQYDDGAYEDFYNERSLTEVPPTTEQEVER